MRVVNDLGDTKLFLDKLIAEIRIIQDSYSPQIINPINFTEVQELIDTKYNTWDWIFGHTPVFTYKDSESIVSKVRKGKIEESSNNLSIGKRFDEIL
jgi:hypothetical protein